MGPVSRCPLLDWFTKKSFNTGVASFNHTLLACEGHSGVSFLECVGSCLPACSRARIAQRIGAQCALVDLKKGEWYRRANSYADGKLFLLSSSRKGREVV